jgi:hypothetical protein
MANSLFEMVLSHVDQDEYIRARRSSTTKHDAGRNFVYIFYDTQYYIYIYILIFAIKLYTYIYGICLPML